MPKLAKETAKQSTKQPMENQKELQYAKVLQKDKAEGVINTFSL